MYSEQKRFYESFITSFPRLNSFCKEKNPAFVYTETAIDYLNFLLISCDGKWYNNFILKYPFEKFNDDNCLRRFINLQEIRNISGEIADTFDLDHFLYEPIVLYILCLLESKYESFMIIDAWHIQDVIFDCNWLKNIFEITSEKDKIPIYFSNENNLYMHEVSREFMVGFMVVYNMIKECPSAPVIYQKDLFLNNYIKDLFLISTGVYHTYKYTIVTAENENYGFNTTDFIDGFKSAANWSNTQVNSLYNNIYRWKYDEKTDILNCVENLSVK